MSSQRFQSVEHLLAWFSPCLAFCLAPILVAVTVYAIVRVVRGRRTPPSHPLEGAVDRVNTEQFRYQRPQAPPPPHPPPGQDNPPSHG